MSALPTPGLVSVQDYLDGELAAAEKHEYLGGVVHAMAGGTRRHNAVSSNAVIALGARLRGKPCRAFASDAKVRVQSPTQIRFYYPDATVVCNDAEDGSLYEDEPVVLIEVLSPSTRRIDDGEKRDAYLSIPSLRVFLRVEPDRPLVIVDRRVVPGFGFALESYEGENAVIPLPEIGTELPLRDLYEA
ncbi:Uma2 family endonuclease [Phycisphaera mikurensis]|uniref:Putative restriction endonuclease domain-containing protein n=1 Tax=Phycisphaera mikurensis (strain NBRC 102666 / KCTC 22515 / FYK2301M01) TaxID=1142394 RepID=I0IIP0_PHYMF|nr:Uma2 family endonuclease [Phycisphaera mikurensis]MBB6442720.1 Uma2 family endonuclease [Phycisphaera mikurensis]BAM05128.1 hypothetical protein PSMK_29690 [Phycisphaera mikurensis NBRC 102666]